MTAEPTEGGPNAKVVPLRAAEAPTETSLGEAEPPAYVDTTGADAGARLRLWADVPGASRGVAGWQYGVRPGGPAGGAI